MSSDSLDGNLLPTSTKPRPSPRYNLLSLGAPLLGLVVVWLFLGIVGIDSFYSREMAWKSQVAVTIFAAACAIGMVLGLIAVVRSERRWWLTMVGLLFNAPFLVLLLWVGLEQLQTWLRYG